MTETITRQDMLDKVRKLLAKAESVAGTPEADVLNAKAFELIAKYGIDETAARQRAGEGPASIEVADFVISGQYQREQTYLLHLLAKALHCSPLWDAANSAYGTRRNLVYGTAGHIERLRIVYAMLMPQMLAGAARVRPPADAQVGVKAYRMSWMRGFYGTVESRLRKAESRASEASEPGTALVLVDDYKRAEAAMESSSDDIRSTRSRSRHSAAAAALGAAAGERVNLGQTGVAGRLAIG
ncbi:DUF2786 domain-containing protein [Nocardia testacea]|uniref:DUF2786 domain-containing protein n=1 Tax=Nocardia testacea TaxID=248551 RepID=UPI00030A9E48|nr:DUF2786 domain-containing protein [Nocardia testacea]